MALNTLIIGDVHGCYHTFRELVETHWNPAKAMLVQLGDLVDRGNFSPETVAFARALERQYPERTAFLKGNHEAELVTYWRKGIAHQAPQDIERFISNDGTLRQYQRTTEARARLQDDMQWCAALPLYWNAPCVFVSHAGIAAVWATWQDALHEDHPEGILWTRSRLRRLDKMQVIGHTPQKTGFPEFRIEEHVWNIDTAAVFGKHLTALHLAPTGEVIDIIIKPTKPNDYPHR